MDEWTELLEEKDNEIAALKAKIAVLEKTLETIHEMYEVKTKQAVRTERIRSEEQHRPWRPVYPGD